MTSNLRAICFIDSISLNILRFRYKRRPPEGANLRPPTLHHSSHCTLRLVGVSLFFSLAIFVSPPATPRQSLAKQDAPCLACHGQPGLKSETGKDISIRPEAHAASVHGILGCRDCHASIREFPHSKQTAKVQCGTCHAEVSAFAKTVHATLGAQGCTLCHGNVHEVTAAAKLVPAKCAECHQQQVSDFAASAHGRVAKGGDADAPTCTSCHGTIHGSGSLSGPGALGRRQVVAICSGCHSDSNFLARHKGSIAHPVEQYVNSMHGQAVAQGKDAATCSDCHGAHNILPARDPASTVNHWRVAETCSACHREIVGIYLESVHGRAMTSGMQDAPTCTDCHGEHLILPPKNPESPVNFANVSMETCARCHGDARLARRHDLPADRVPSYADSYHGLALREGSLRAANCASCHGIHNIFRSSDPRSTVHRDNLAKTCGKCHRGVKAASFIGPIHVRTSTGPAHPTVLWIRRVYWVLIPISLTFMILHNLLDLIGKVRRGIRRSDGAARVLRMNLWFRIAHWGVMLSFPVLVYTGFALKYPEQWWTRPMLRWEQQTSFRGGLHRAAAVTLIAATLYHLVHLCINRRDRSFLRAMLPAWADVRDLIRVVRYNLGVGKEAPHFAKFNYAEKLEYWAFLWGTAIMSATGFLLWFDNFALRHFPKWVSDAATAVHWYEALLATFSILLWHFYMVIFDPVVYPMNLAWLTGKVPAEHLECERPEYFQSLVAGVSGERVQSLDRKADDTGQPPVTGKDS